MTCNWLSYISIGNKITGEFIEYYFKLKYLISLQQDTLDFLTNFCSNKLYFTIHHSNTSKALDIFEMTGSTLTLTSEVIQDLIKHKINLNSTLRQEYPDHFYSLSCQNSCQRDNL